MLERLKSNWKVAAALMVLLILIVMLGCWYLWAPAPAVPEVYAPPAKQGDGSVVLEKKPDAKAKPKQVIPKGAKVERVVSVTVQPRAVQPVHTATSPAPQVNPLTSESNPQETAPAAPAVVAAAPCPPVTVDLSLLILEDKTWRVIASSPDGEVVGGVDIPVQDAEPPPAPKLWAAGIVGDPFRKLGGVFVDRDVAFARLGLQVNQKNEGDFPNQVWIKAGIRF